jgi:hypothetical protein
MIKALLLASCLAAVAKARGRGPRSTGSCVVWKRGAVSRDAIASEAKQSRSLSAPRIARLVGSAAQRTQLLSQKTAILGRIDGIMPLL